MYYNKCFVDKNNEVSIPNITLDTYDHNFFTVAGWYITKD